MNKVLVISGHPNLEKSYANKVIINDITKSIENASIRRLDALYPNFQINTQAEQDALINANIIILLFPFYWYSMPALLKKWIDDVFTFNFAYGPQGNKLKNKDFLVSITVGGPEESYNPLGYNHFRINELLKPLEQTAYLAGMNYQTPIVSHRMVYIPDVYNTQEDVEFRASKHALNLIAKIKELMNKPTE
ncbi:MAG: NAD(P)H-dependent oxidoreductase [Alphaproteobacteria bacterium]|nr:NAD(P)H-dependent oxidoreductase [Alphaproteobacteria bacterium]